MVRESDYYCKNMGCERHLSKKEESGLGKKVLTGCDFSKGNKHYRCRDRITYLSPKDKYELMKDLKKEIGTRAFNNLINRKAFLFKWRMTTPYNFWVAPKNDEENFLYHSEGNESPDLRFFKKVRDSKEKIIMSLYKCERGLPQETTYRLKKDFVEAYKKYRELKK